MRGRQSYFYVLRPLSGSVPEQQRSLKTWVGEHGSLTKIHSTPASQRRRFASQRLETHNLPFSMTCRCYTMDRSSGSTAPPESLSLEERLGKFRFDRDVLEETITGKIVPSDLGSPEVQACVIRAIRHHNGYGKELRGYAAFDRALNARAIMSNRIPEIYEKEQEPYCIW